MRIRTALFSTAALALAATGSFLGVAATSASAAPPVHHTLSSTGVQIGGIQHIGPNVTITRDLEYSASPNTPGFTLSGSLTEVCFAIPHMTPPGPHTPLAICNWSLVGRPLVPPPGPQNTLHGTALLTGLGSVGRVTGGTGEWAGAFSILPNQTTFTNIAPRTEATTINFFLP